MISGSNINLDFLYLVNKKDLKKILETGIIKKSKKDTNYSDKVFLMSNTSINKNIESIKVLIVKNLKSNKLSDSPIKIWNLIKMKEEIINSHYRLYGIPLKNYLYRKYYCKKKNNTRTSSLDKIVELIVDGIIEEGKNIKANYKGMIDECENTLESMIEMVMKGINNNNNLIISETKNKIFLPYTVDEIDNFMRYYPRSYITASDVVKREYIINLTDVTKHPYRARFKEAYNLMRNRENKGIVSSFINAIRISLKRKLNPAVIASCRSKTELKKYLICLKYNQLENFEMFNTIYEFANT